MSISTHLLKNITGADDAAEIHPVSCLVKGDKGRNHSNITLGLGQVTFGQFISNYKAWPSKGNREPLPTAVLSTLSTVT